MKLIQRLRHKHSIKMLCRIFGVSRSSYYQALQHKPSAREVTNNAIKQRILEIYLQSKRRYGCIKIRQLLLQQGVLISQNKVLRLMREMQIRSIVSKKYRPHASKQSPSDRKNLVNRQFSASKPNQIWLSDITYIRTKNNGWTYLASILDVCTRKIVGYSYAKKMTVDLTLQALHNAYHNQNRPKNVILHSDQGAQYTARSYQKQADQLGITLSFSRKGCPYDNAPMEAFHSILKKEEVYQTAYQDFHHAKLQLFDYIEGFYNRNPIHSAIGFLSPIQFERSFAV